MIHSVHLHRFQIKVFCPQIFHGGSGKNYLDAESKYRPSEVKELIKDFYESRISEAV